MLSISAGEASILMRLLLLGAGAWRLEEAAAAANDSSGIKIG